MQQFKLIKMSSDANHIFYVFLGYASVILNTRIKYCFFSIGVNAVS